ncbi:hypothetical protein EOD41_02775 [Mucilaginibacter limnophilus]|uniref:Signal transduction histidine kinase internal region domain-containing protein n=1 Tax=Mucilaginibacter limnophilus TaxID=1932778 RepID=A0A437MZ09_9SPHI|nr:histidine kinase [Mucilaginibacter limnophilus]RVU02878.1 hypothetical protein EOD41_02775 [Mucilaginibacter limnophilus]
MTFPEKKLRVYGSLVAMAFFFVFFMMEMLFSPTKADHLFLKIFIATVPFTIAFWEPTRWLILKLRSRFPDIRYSGKRFKYAMLVLIPYGLLLAYLKVYIEIEYKVWGYAMNYVSYYTWTAGIVLLFILVQAFVYEGVYFFQQWVKSLSEAEDLKRLNLEMQFDSLKVQIQPHFLFNSLNTLVALIEFDTNRAKKFTLELAHMYRYFLEANSSNLVNLSDELDFAQTYFFLLKTRYEDGLYLDVHTIADLDRYSIPPLSLQVLLENAIKHNRISTAEPLYINISIDANQHVITVKNNIQIKEGAIKTGHGLSHLKRKFELIGFPLVIINNAEENGYFEVTLPLIDIKTV